MSIVTSNASLDKSGNKRGISPQYRVFYLALSRKCEILYLRLLYYGAGRTPSDNPVPSEPSTATRCRSFDTM
uniref:Uncharacterized protein n=1 Tax=Pararge aegeria TaxID=116150 RepID=S4PT63_9NEOP